MKALFILLTYLPLSLLFALTACSEPVDASRYCSVPPFAYTSVPPNVLLIFDNSGSMYEFAYKGGYRPSKLYYGYFEPRKKYSYTGGRNGYFYESPRGEWEGNFLNWLVMRRIDVAKKVLVGGDFYKKGSDFFLRCADNPDRDFKKGRFLLVMGYLLEGSSSIPGNWKWVPGYSYIDWKRKRVLLYQPITSWLRVRRYWHFSRAFRLHVKASSEPEGIVQRTWNRVRFGLMLFNDYGNYYEDGYGKDGGRVVHFLSGPAPSGELVRKIQRIELKTWTPLAEAYYEAIRYFRAGGSAYSRFDYSKFDPVKYKCQKNFVILITDGESTKDQNLPGTCFFHRGRAHVKDNKGFNVQKWMSRLAEAEGHPSQRCDLANSSGGTYYLEGVAYYSHVTDLREDLEGFQNLTLYSIFVFDESPVGKELLKKASKYGGFRDLNGNKLPDLRSEWDGNGDGVPDNYYEAQDGYKLERVLLKVIEDIVRRASGTSVSIFPSTSPTSRGMVLSQTLFYYEKGFGKRNLNWVGYIYTWWFLNAKGAQNVREDTKEDKVLELAEDRIVRWVTEDGNLRIYVYSSTPDGKPSQLLKSYSSFDELTPLWEGGSNLAESSPDNRRIYTASGSKLIPFTVRNLKYFEDELGEPTSFPSCLGSSPENLVRYIRGEHLDGCRDRRVGEKEVWKLGDIVYSTPALLDYANYSVVFVGANDGMLHAFKMGYLKELNSKATPVKLQDSSSEPSAYSLGEELWAFIPRGALPYLRFLADQNYCHVYYVDLKPFIVKVDLDGDGVRERSILIGGMRLGGGVDCSGCFQECISPPGDVNGGYSSYFALDVTEPNSPKFLWEFSDRELGFTYSGPAVVKKGSRYYVVFASGPTDYKGNSCKDLKFFVLDLLSGDKKATIATGLRGAFGGRLFNYGYDFDGDGYTDYLFGGFTRRSAKGYSGGIFKLDVRSSDPEDWEVELIDSLYDLGSGASVPLGPVTSQVVVGSCFDKPYLYFGTGKWFYKTDDSGLVERLVALPVVCNSSECKLTPEVLNSSGKSGAEEVCYYLRTGRRPGWYIDLDVPGGKYLAERLITDPSVLENVVSFSTVEPTSEPCEFGGRSRVWLLNCATGGSISQQCKGYEVSGFSGSVILQMSGADIRQAAVSKEGQGSGPSGEFTKKGGRATGWFSGIVSESSPSTVRPSKGLVGRLLLWLER